MTDNGSNPLTTTSETLTDGSGGWYVLSYDTGGNIASASSAQLSPTLKFG